MPSNIDTIKCILCESIGAVFLSNIRDSNKNWAVKCSHCGHVQLWPLPSIEEDEEFYKKDDLYRNLISKNHKSDNELMKKYEVWADVQVKNILPRISTKDKLVEVGSGYGWFIEKIALNGINATGIEINSNKCLMARERSGQNFISMNILIDEIPTNMLHSFDVVCLFNVLEHFSNPIKALKKIITLLKPSGKIYIEVPNLDDYFKSLSKEYNSFFYSRAHISYFTSETLSALLTQLSMYDIHIYGLQNYSIESAINWARNGVPYVDGLQFFLPDKLEWINQYFKNELEKKLISGSLLAEASV